MTKRIFTLLVLSLALALSPARTLANEVMFEGYYRIELENKPIGYLIERYEFDPVKHEFTEISFQHAKIGGKIIQESLKGRATDKFEPVAYQYTGQVGEAISIIDATFKGDVMTLMKTDGKKTVKNEKYKNPKGAFLSSFLTFVMMQKKVTLNQAFTYDAIAEESGGSYSGKSWFESKDNHGSYSIFRVLNKYKGEQFVSNIAVVPDPKNPDHFIKAEVLGTNSPAKNIKTVLVASPLQATEGQMVPTKVLITLFGSMPTGKMNMVATPLAEKGSVDKFVDKPNPKMPAKAPEPKMIPSPVPAAEDPPAGE